MMSTALRPAIVAAALAPILALFLDWRGRLVRRLRTGRDGAGAEHDRHEEMK